MDFLPKVKMDFVPQDDEKVSLNIEDDPLPPPMTEEEHNEMVSQEKKVQFKEEASGQGQMIAEPVKKGENIDVNEIFNLSEDDKKVMEKSENIKLTKKGKPFKKRPPMTEAHKLKLKEARIKAMAVRKSNAATRKADKELEKKSKELLRTKKKKEVEQLEKEVSTSQQSTTSASAGPPSNIDIEKAVLEGITKYEILRKQRKKEKAVLMEQENREKEVKDKLRRAIAPRKSYNPYSHCY